MKSILFREVDISRKEDFSKEQFIQDLSILLKLSSEEINNFLNVYKKILLTKLPSEGEIIKKEYLQQSLIEEKDYSKLSKLAKFFFGLFMKGETTCEDNPNDIVDDLIEIEAIKADEKEKAQSFLQSIKTLVQIELDEEIRRIKAKRKGIPTFESASSAVDFRAVFENEGKFGETAKGYMPIYKGVVPIIQLSLSLSNDNQSSVNFEIDKDRLQYFRNMIEQTLVEIDEAQKALNLEVER